MEIVAYNNTFIAVPADADSIREESYHTELVFSGDISAVMWLLPSIPPHTDPMEWLYRQPGVSKYVMPENIVPRPDLGLTCILRIHDNPQASARLDDLCQKLTGASAPKVVIPSMKPPKGTMLSTAKLDGTAVSVWVGPGMTQNRSPSDRELYWGCSVPGSHPSSDDYWADTPECWVSTYVSVRPSPVWPATPDGWLRSEEKLVDGAVSETEAWITSRVFDFSVKALYEVRAYRGLKVGDRRYTCTAGQRMVPGGDEKAALERVAAMCATLLMAPPP